MLKIKTISTFLVLVATSLFVSALPTADYDTGYYSPPVKDVCGTCNPIAGKNYCDVTTSCINTGKHFHCACRAGYKATKYDDDKGKQFRLHFKNYEFLVFTPEHTKCDVLCDDPYAPADKLCHEVKLADCEA
ncbi:hypothetical protein AJ79_04851 [Helicocarpus griseus UAMH5409]|uniref:Adhesin n=1 Tax=Helicocarpus griseus UAMH5409 TaxID=1447875 RepID=A0A2B7XQK1_9EURO|nr:hypothetical protein AJ79_04851 [Helicocarpus griseus UAMH5409]